MKKTKKPRVVYKQNDSDAKAEELEEFLFGAAEDATVIFEREKEDGKETVADLIKQATRSGGLLLDSHLFFEDTRAAADSDEHWTDPEDSGSSDNDSGAAGARRRKGAKAAAAGTKGRRGLPGSDPDGGAGASSEEAGEDEEEPGGQGEGSEDGDREEEEEEEEEGARARSSASAGSSGEQGVEGAGRGRAAEAAGGRQQKHKVSGPGGRVPVWSDPHDAEVAVALTSRTRKLRKADGQTTLDGPEYEAALRQQHQKLNPRTKWAARRQAPPRKARDGDEDDDDADGDAGADDAEAAALMAQAGGLTVRPAGLRLPAGQIETTRLRDANQHQPSAAVVQSVRFHPNGQLLLTAGLDKALRLFQVDGVRNPLVQGVHLDDLPITAAEFAGPQGQAAAEGGAEAADRVVMAGRRPFFYVYDMGAARVERLQGPGGCGLKSLERFAVSPASSCSSSSEPLVAFTGDCGLVPLVSLRTRQWVASLKMSGNVRALAFSADGNELASTGDDGVVHLWDLRTRRCRLTFADSGNIGDASSLALSPNGAWLATGSKSGAVNVYRRAELEAAAGGGQARGGRVAVAPARELLQLTTDVDTLQFSPDSQVLAFASRMKKDSLRLAHLPSLTVFANWPTGRSPLHYVHSLDFSPHCGLLAIGNAKGRALLYRLHHYGQA